ncbi:MAG: FtsW/RodA/SpoVE family cell cycle protein [Phycisphaerales bacterium]
MLCALALLMIGVVMVQSAGMEVLRLGQVAQPDQVAESVTAGSLLTSRAALYLVMAIVAMIVASRLPIRKLAARLDRVVWFKPGGDLGVLLIGSMLLIGLVITVYIPGLERPRNGAHRWIDLKLPGLDSMQPSELAKWGLVVLVAWYAARLGSYREHRLRIFWRGLLPAVLCIGAVAFAVVMEDLGTGVLMVLACSIVLLAGGAKLWHFATFVPIGVAGVVAAIVTSPYRVKRITAFLDPYADAQGEGYQMIQSMTTIAGGGFFGRGLGNGLQKFGYLPEDTTDFLFAVVCEEMGFMGALAIIAAYGAVVWVGTDIARREKSTVLRLIVIGVIATFSIQAVINLMVVTGLGPTKGIALPLLSNGGTGWIVTSVCLGLVVAIERTQEYASAFDGSLESDISFAQRTGLGLGVAVDDHEIGAQEMSELMGDTGFSSDEEIEVVVPKRSKRFSRKKSSIETEDNTLEGADEWFADRN